MRTGHFHLIFQMFIFWLELHMLQVPDQASHQSGKSGSIAMSISLATVCFARYRNKRHILADVKGLYTELHAAFSSYCREQNRMRELKRNWILKCIKCLYSLTPADTTYADGVHHLSAWIALQASLFKSDHNSVDHVENHWEASCVCVPTHLARSELATSENFQNGNFQTRVHQGYNLDMEIEALLCLRLTRELLFSIWIHTHKSADLAIFVPEKCFPRGPLLRKKQTDWALISFKQCVFTMWHHLTASYVPNGALDRHHAALGVH